MTLTFEAIHVSCTDAIDGQIQQVGFDTVTGEHSETNRSTPYLLIGRDFEFPGSAAVEWHDGQEYDGGAEICSVILRRDRVLLVLDCDIRVEVTFHLSDRKYLKLETFLKRLIDRRFWLPDGIPNRTPQ